MTRDDVLAVVVSFNGAECIAGTVERLRTQVAGVHVVDNGSSAATLRVLSALEEVEGVTVERLADNHGIAHALNRGLARARALDVPWLLTMDQDSSVDPGLIAAYGRALAAHPDRVCLTPTITTGARRGAPDADDVVAYAITSGNLVRTDICEAVGGYDEGLFIDCVDFDFSLRLRRAGHAVYRVADAFMHHRLGEEREVPAFARRFYALHSPVRRYYMYRNYLYLAERHALRFPGFIAKLGLGQVILLPLIGLFDTTPLRSYGAVLRGVAHWVTRRRGPLPVAAA
jgi:rhamnosyltransferase